MLPLANGSVNKPSIVLSTNPCIWATREELIQRWSFVWGALLSKQQQQYNTPTMNPINKTNNNNGFKDMNSHLKLQPSYLRLKCDKFAIDEELHAYIELNIPLNSICARVGSDDLIKINSRWLEATEYASHTPITLLRRLFSIKGTYEAFIENEHKISSVYEPNTSDDPETPDIMQFHRERDEEFKSTNSSRSLFHFLHTPETWKSAEFGLKKYAIYPTSTDDNSNYGDLPTWPKNIREYAMISYGYYGALAANGKLNGYSKVISNIITADIGLTCFDHVICTFIRTYRFLSGIASVSNINNNLPDKTFEIDYHILSQEFAIPIPSELISNQSSNKYQSIISLFKSGHTIMATCLFRLYHLHRLLRYAKLIEDVHLYHQIQLLIDSHLPLWSIMVKFSRWSDIAILDTPLICKDAKNPLDETSLHPRAPAKFEERLDAFVDVAYGVEPSKSNSNPIERRIEKGVRDYIQKNYRVGERASVRKNKDQMEKIRNSIKNKLKEEDLKNNDRGRMPPNHNATSLQIEIIAHAYWPLSIAVLTWEECTDMSRPVMDANYMYEDTQRREEYLFSGSLEHLMVGKVLFHKCAMRADAGMSARYFEKHPTIAYQFSLFIQLVSYGNIPDFIFHTRPNFATRVRLWCTYKFEIGNTPAAWINFIKDHRFISQHALKSIVAHTITRMPGLEKVLRLRPNFGMWMSMIDYSCNIFRRNLNQIPYDNKKSKLDSLIRKRAIILHMLEIEAILARIHRIVSKYANVKLHKGCFSETMISACNKFYQGLQSQLEQMKKDDDDISSSSTDNKQQYNRRMREVVDHVSKMHRLKWIASQRPKEYDDHMMRIFAWRVARSNPNRSFMPTYFLQYFGVPKKAIETLRIWMLYFNVYDMSDNWYQKEISCLWQRYPASFCVIWTYMTYLYTFQSEVPVILPIQLHDIQMQARRHSLQLMPYEHTSKENLNIFYYCCVCKKWTHPMAPVCNILNIAPKPGEKFLDPIEQAIQKQLASKHSNKNIIRINDAANNIGDDSDTDDDEDDEDDDENEDKKSNKKLRSTARNTIPALGVYGIAPTAYINHGCGSSIGTHTLNTRSGVAVNGAGIGTTTEASGLYSTDTTKSQYDPISDKNTCAQDTSKRGSMRNHRLIFGIPQTYEITNNEELRNSIINMKEPDMSEYYAIQYSKYNDITKLMISLITQKQKSKYATKKRKYQDEIRAINIFHGFIMTPIPKTLDEVTEYTIKQNECLSQMPEELKMYLQNEINNNNASIKKKRGRPSSKNKLKSQQLGSNLVSSTNTVNTNTINSNISNSPNQNEILPSPVKLNELSNDNSALGGLDVSTMDIDGDEFDAFAAELEKDLLQDQENVENAELQKMLGTDLDSILADIPSSVTRAKRCKAELIPVKLIGRIFYLKRDKPYVLCSLCCSIMLALPTHYVPEYGFVCSRHGISNCGFDAKTGTLIASPHAKVQTNVTLDAVGNKGFLRLNPTFYITRNRQLNGIPTIWLLKYNYSTIAELLDTYVSGFSKVSYWQDRLRTSKDRGNKQRLMPTVTAKGYPFSYLINNMPHGISTTPPRAFQCDICKDKFYLETVLVDCGKRRLCFKHWKYELKM